LPSIPQGEHDLKALGTKLIHCKPPKLSQLSNLLNKPIRGRFLKSRQKSQISKITK